MKISGVLSKNYLRNFLLVSGGTFAVGTLISAAVLYADMYEPLHTNYGEIISIVSGLQESLISRTLKINVIFYIFTSAGIGLLSVLYSHRIAGPLYRIKKYLKSIADGTPDRELKLRHKDAIESFALTINEMTGSFRKRRNELISHIDQLKAAVNELNQCIEQGRPLEDTLDKIIHTDNRMSSLLKSIKVNE